MGEIHFDCPGVCKKKKKPGKKGMRGKVRKESA